MAWTVTRRTARGPGGVAIVSALVAAITLAPPARDGQAAPGLFPRVELGSLTRRGPIFVAQLDDGGIAELTISRKRASD